MDPLPSSFVRRCVAVAAAQLLCSAGYALPQGGAVVGGQATLQAQGAGLVVQQHSPRAAIDWRSFGVAAGESVRFVQPGAHAVALNRVTGAEASAILGRLDANGQVFLLNPNGVLFGRGAQVQVGGLLASTLDLRPADFMAGRTQLTGAASGRVRNARAATAPASSWKPARPPPSSRRVAALPAASTARPCGAWMRPVFTTSGATSAM